MTQIRSKYDSDVTSLVHPDTHTHTLFHPREESRPNDSRSATQEAAKYRGPGQGSEGAAMSGTEFRGARIQICFVTPKRGGGEPLYSPSDAATAAVYSTVLQRAGE